MCLKRDPKESKEKESRAKLKEISRNFLDIQKTWILELRTQAELTCAGEAEELY